MQVFDEEAGSFLDLHDEVPLVFEALRLAAVPFAIASSSPASASARALLHSFGLVAADTGQPADDQLVAADTGRLADDGLVPAHPERPAASDDGLSPADNGLSPAIEMGEDEEAREGRKVVHIQRLAQRLGVPVDAFVLFDDSHANVNKVP